jgi:hypothetical protein|tara:strand:- start:7847 stop:9490 length:1644 start_codon:yes stop_codon:yes gene_type:complete
MVKFVNRVKLNLTTTGTGTVTFGSVVDGFQSLADASVVDSDVVRYTIESGTNYEVGTGTIGLSGGTYTMARSPSSSSESDNSAINLGSGAVCFLTMLAEDVVQVLADLDNVSSAAPAGGQNLAWDSGTSSWVPASPSGGITSVGNFAGLPSSPNETDLAWVQDTKSLYVYDGAEWDRFYTDTNATPDWDTPPPTEPQSLSSSGTATVQTVAASDPEGFPIEYTFDTSPTSQAQATISNTAGVFTITPSQDVADEGQFTLRYRVSDGIHSNARSTIYSLSFYSDPDIANAVSDSKSFSFNPPEATAFTVRFNTSGSKMYCFGYTTDTVYEYSLSSPFDVSTTAPYVASGSGATPRFYVGSQEGTGRGLDFSADGTKMYILGSTNDKVFEYDLSTGFDVTTAVYNNNFASIGGLLSNPNEVRFSTTGHRMYVTGTSVDKIFQLDLSTNFDITTAQYNSVNLNVGSLVSSAYPYGIAWNKTGSKMYHCDNYRNKVWEWDLTTNWDISTASNVAEFSPNSSFDPVSITFSTDGSKMFIIFGTDDKVHQYSV